METLRCWVYPVRYRTPTDDDLDVRYTYGTKTEPTLEVELGDTKEEVGDELEPWVTAVGVAEEVMQADVSARLLDVP
jgi:hypothetical protein